MDDNAEPHPAPAGNMRPPHKSGEGGWQAEPLHCPGCGETVGEWVASPDSGRALVRIGGAPALWHEAHGTCGKCGGRIDVTASERILERLVDPGRWG